MADKKIAHYGDWETPINAGSVVSKSKSLSFPRVCQQSGRAFYIESRENGDSTIMEILDNKVAEVLPTGYSAVNTVYESGTRVYDILLDGRIIFSNRGDTVHILDPDTKTVTLLIGKPSLRYGGFSAHPMVPWVLAIEEDHTIDTPEGVTNRIVAINVDTAGIKPVITGADFYFSNIFSPDGTHVSWLEWDHPNLFFDDARVCCADWNDDGSITNIKLIAGQDHESAAQPFWGVDGSLYFGKEVNGYRQLFRLLPNSSRATQIKFNGLEQAEFGLAWRFEGGRNFIPLTKSKIFATVVQNGMARFVLLDVDKSDWSEAIKPENICVPASYAMAKLTETSALIVGAGTTRPLTLYKIDFGDSNRLAVIRTSTDSTELDQYYSPVEALHIHSQGSPSRSIHGFLWMPHNPKYIAPEAELPPLIVNSHGGPIGATNPGLSLWGQYFTSRGYAYFALNYTGSAWHGRDYRRRLYGNWGIIDADDAAECAVFLVSTGRVRQGAVGIMGNSAGGYNVLQCLTRHPGAFAGGICACGISDIRRLDATTHKLESHFASLLLFDKDTTEERKEQLYRERSPLYHADMIESPLLVIHGTNDTVVPIEQARSIVEILEQKKGVVKMIEIEGERHSLSKPETRLQRLAEEEAWWRKTLLGLG